MSAREMILGRVRAKIPRGPEGARREAVERRLAEHAVEKLAPISSEMARLLEHPDEIDAILARGAERARAIAQPILRQTYDIVGMVR